MDVFCSMSIERSRNDSSRDDVWEMGDDGLSVHVPDPLQLNVDTDGLASEAPGLVRELPLEQLLNKRRLRTSFAGRRRVRRRM